MFLAAPKNLLGLWSAFESSPPDNTLPLEGIVALYALASLVIESSKITTSFPCSTNLFAFSNTISATWICLSAGSSKVEETTSPFTDLCISVTSSGLSSISKTIKTTSGLFSVIAFAIFCKRTVFPVLGGAFNKTLCPFPIGINISIILVDISFVFVSKTSFSLGYNGVKLSKKGLSLILSRFVSPFILVTFKSAKYFSWFWGDLTYPPTVSPFLNANFFIWGGAI